MTRTKEVEPGSGQMPDYKSPSSRLVHSLRQGYDNIRLKLQEARQRIKYYQIKERDLENSREAWKEKFQEKDNEIEELKRKLKALEKENEALEKASIDLKEKKRKL